jgi:biopolymer transport protein ExbD
MVMENESLQKDVIEKIFAERRCSFTLRMAPMIDMIFLLLIFFLVAARWRPVEDFLPFQLPVAQAQQLRIGKPQPLVIYITAAQNGCRVRLDSLKPLEIKNRTVEQDLTVLMEKIRDCMLAQKRFVSDPVEIVCEPEVKWQYVAKIYNVFFGAGLTDITFAMTE